MTLLLTAAWSAIGALSAQAAVPGAAEARDLPAQVAESGVRSGLCVVLPAGDGAALGAAADNGRFVVQGLVPDAAQVDSVRAAIPAALHGLVSVRGWTAGTPLPFADGLVDVLVVDADALGAACPADQELLRVVTPQAGALRIRRKGAWTTVRAPRPAAFGTWSHYYGDATGNPVSNDNVPGPATALQWIGDSPAGVLDQTYILSDADTWVATQFDRPNNRNQLVVRSGFNGFHRWTKLAEPRTGRLERNGAIAAIDGRIYTLAAPERGPLVAYNAADGAEAVRFEGDLPALVRGGRSTPPTHPGNLAVWEDYVVLVRADKAICWDRRTGARRWVFDGAGKNLAYPAVDPRNRRVGLLIARDASAFMYGDRETTFHPSEIVSLALADGREAWRVPYPFRDIPVPEDRGSSIQMPYRNVSAFLWADGAFLMNKSKGLGEAGVDIASVDAATGQTRWAKANLREWAGGAGDPGAGVGTLLAYPQAVVLTRSAVLLFNPASGDSLGQWRVGNSRCDNASGSAWGFVNFGHFFGWGPDQRLQTARSEIARNNCGGFATPGNGMLYYQPQVCGCFAAVRGMMALSRQQPGEPTPDAQRLVKGPAASTPPARREQEGDWPTLLADFRRSAAGTALATTTLRERWRTKVGTGRLPGPIAAKEQASAAFNGPVSAPVVAGGLVIVSEPDAHRVHALDAATGKLAWSTTLGGRVDTPPTVAGGRVYAGSRDGWVTCLDLATGQVVWRFLAARNHRQIGAWGQLESPWPVHGSLVVADGLVMATAGYHPDADGGIQAWGLDAATGAVRWKRTLAIAREAVALDPAATSTRSQTYFTPNRVLNGVPSSDGVVAVLPGLRMKLSDGSGPAQLGGRAVPGKGAAGDPLEPELTGRVVSSWGLVDPWLRSTLGNFDGPGDVLGRQGYRVDGATPRRAAWNGDLLAALHMKSSELLLFDPRHPIGPRYNDTRVQKEDEAVKGVGLLLGRLELSDARVKKPAQYGPSTQDPSAMILAGSTLVIAWAPDVHNTPRASVAYQDRPESILQLVDLKERRVISSAPVSPGVIEHGLATAGGLLYMVHDDGSVSAWGE